MGSCSSKRKLTNCYSSQGCNASEWPNLSRVEVETLQLLFKELASRNHSETRLDKLNFLSYFQIPGILGEKLFSQFDSKSQNFIESDDFIRGIKEYCRGEYSQVVKRMFELFKFNESEAISHEELNYLFHNFMKDLLEKESQKADEKDHQDQKNIKPPINPPTISYSYIILPSVDFAEFITEQFSQTAGGLTYPDFENFLEKCPEIYINFLKIFCETTWRDYNATVRTGYHSASVHKAKNFEPAPVFFAGEIVIEKNTINIEAYGVIRGNIFLVFDSERLISVVDVIYLNGCYLKIEQDKCTIFQYNNSMPRMSFKSRSEIKIEAWEQELKLAGDIKKFRDIYELGDRIGHGKFSDVHTACEKFTNEIWAVKIMKRKKTNSIERELIHNEINILKILNHKGIVKLKDVFCNSTHTLLVEEFLHGGSLEKCVGSLSENDIKTIVYQLLEVINYIHEVGVIHRDIKLDNVLFAKKNDLETLKLADFGLSTFAIPGKVFTEACGTIGYTAPEMHDKFGYGNEVDLWSLGVLAYALLAEKMPFRGTSNQEIISATMNKEPDYAEIANYSLQAQDFVKKLLRKNPAERPKALDSMKHEWFNR